MKWLKQWWPTLYPIALAIGANLDPNLVSKHAHIIATSFAIVGVVNHQLAPPVGGN